MSEALYQPAQRWQSIADFGCPQQHVLPQRPHVHSFALFKSTPVTDTLALHEARLHAHLAREPGVEVRPVSRLADIEEFENRLRTHAREFRLANGITDPEIRGMNIQFNDVFAHELKREVAERLAALQAG